jgi:transposase, IS30 family
LYSSRPGRRHKKNGNQGKIPALVPISERPEIINTRLRVGDWETDLVVSKRGTPTAISSNIDRKSRYLVANKVQNQTSSEKQKTLQILIEEFLVHSMTYDRGHENVKHNELGVATYFCNPYSSWEKGSIENANKCLRRYIPKKTDLSTITEKKLQEYVNKINNKPRKILGYKTALEVATELGLFKKVINSVS